MNDITVTPVYFFILDTLTIKPSIKPNKPIISQNIRIKTNPVKNLGCFKIVFIPMLPTSPIAIPAQRLAKPVIIPEENCNAPEKNEYPPFTSTKIKHQYTISRYKY